MFELSNYILLLLNLIAFVPGLILDVTTKHILIDSDNDILILNGLTNIPI